MPTRRMTVKQKEDAKLLNPNASDGKPFEIHKGMMENPKHWPRWPWLPLKRPHPDEMFETALLHADETGQDGRKVPIYTGTTALLPMVHTWFPTAEMRKSMREYSSLDHLLSDGWVVD